MVGAWVLQRWIVTQGKTRAPVRSALGARVAGWRRLPQNDPEAFGLAGLAFVVGARFTFP
jgi:hypothetical protein